MPRVPLSPSDRISSRLLRPVLTHQSSHEHDMGRTYAIILTTSGGLYRYRIGDLVEGIVQCPILRFCGRENNVSDMEVKS